MTVPRRRATVRLLPILTIGLVLLAAACGPSATTSLKPSASTRASTAPASPQLTAVPGRPSGPVIGPTIGPPTTTDTEFGPIFDSLPASFPTLLGQEPADIGGAPTSGSFVANQDVSTASKLITMLLEGQHWTVDIGSPLEDGSVVLDATHAPKGCKSEVRFTPLSGTVIMSVLYGASCPFS